MITNIESTAAPQPGIGSKQRIQTLPEPKVRLPKRVPGRFERPRNAADASQRAMVFSRHTHHDPLQAAIEDGLDAWARHAAASNGFGDLI